MKIKHLLTLAILLILLTSCNSTPSPTPPPETVPEKITESETVAETLPETETTEETAAETEYVDPNIVSYLAEKDFLEPFDKYSWEREFDVEYIVLHFTSNVVNDKNNPHDVGKVKDIFTTTEVSAHYIIDRDGRIKCFIPENLAAWHAGAGTFANDEKYTNKMNKYSIGIEMLAIGSYSDMQYYLTAAEYNSIDKSFIGFTEKQYASLKLLLKDICERNHISFDREHIIGHDEYNLDKNDPGELFDWNRLFE